MRVLGLDLSMRATGVCLLSGPLDQDPEIYTELIHQPQVSSTADRIKRLADISGRVVQFCRGLDEPVSVIIEAAAKNQVWQAAAIGEVHGAVKLRLFLEGIEPVVKEATEMRKVVIGTISRTVSKVVDKKGKSKTTVSYGKIAGKRAGHTKKATVKDIIEARLKERGLSFPTQDEMDAYVAARFRWLALMAEEGIDPSLVQRRPA